MKSVLASLTEKAEIRDEHGTLLGYFTPFESIQDQLRREAFAKFDEESYRRYKEKIANEPKYTTAQVLEHLRSLK